MSKRIVPYLINVNAATTAVVLGRAIQDLFRKFLIAFQRIANLRGSAIHRSPSSKSKPPGLIPMACAPYLSFGQAALFLRKKVTSLFSSSSV